jgi:hypothetical protein
MVAKRQAIVEEPVKTLGKEEQVSLALKAIKSYKPNASVSSYGFISSKGEHTPDWQAPCHASMGRADDVAVFYNIHKHKDEHLNKRFVEWLYGPTSPWKMVLDLNPPMEVDGEEINTHEFIMKHGYIFYNLDIPANLLVNFCIADRSEWEHGQHVATMFEWVDKHGAHPSVAYYFCAQVRDGSLTGYDTGHWSLNFRATKKDYISNFAHGKIVKPLALYSKAKQYIPCNEVWGESDNNSNNYYNYLVKQYGNENNYKERNSGWGSNKIFKPRKEELIQMILAEQKRIGL